MKEKIRLSATVLLACLGAAFHAQAVTPTAEEKADSLSWVTNAFSASPTFSVVCGGEPSSRFLKRWKMSSVPGRITFADPKTGLEMRAEYSVFAEDAGVEWIVYLKNSGKQDSPLLENFSSYDASLSSGKGIRRKNIHRVYWAIGGGDIDGDYTDTFAPQIFAPMRPDAELLLTGSDKTKEDGDGDSSSRHLPFFNVQSDVAGYVMAVGWTGNWAARFECKRWYNSLMACSVSLPDVRLFLRPGEEIRGPRMAMVFYRGGDENGRVRGQNLWRRFFLKHRRPVQNGQPLRGPITYGIWGGTPVETLAYNARKMLEAQWPIECFWLDAGWNASKKTGVPGKTWGADLGSWTIRKDFFPLGFAPLNEAFAGSGMKLMLWHEPERVMPESDWAQELSKEWLLKTPGKYKHYAFNLANPDACQFLIDFMTKRFEQYKLGCYRQDFNFFPGEFWRQNDAPNRHGITEIRYVEGLYRYLDALLAKRPSLCIDNCASGGRRIDYEMCGRSTPMWRADGYRGAVKHQCETLGLMPWVPLNGNSVDIEGNDYDFRSGISSTVCVNWGHSGGPGWKKYGNDFPFAWGKKMLEQYQAIRDLYYGDFYPLTAFSKSPAAFIAWQFHDDTKAAGFVQAFRRDLCPVTSASLQLRGLDPATTYAVKNFDTEKETRMTGKELLEQGLPVQLTACPCAALFSYRAARN
jgi:alpha-galactosidase